MPRSESGQLELRDYLALVKRRKLTILLVVIVVVASSLVVSLLQTPVYRATSQVLLRPWSSDGLVEPQAVGASLRVATEVEVMESRSVREAVAAALGSEPDVAIVAEPETEVVAISAESTDPAEAARIANTYAETYIATRRQQFVDNLLAASEQVEVKLAELNQQLTDLQQPLNDLDAQIAASESAVERSNLQAQRAQLQDDISVESDALQIRRAGYAEQLDQLQLAGNLTESGGAQLVSRALEPAEPVRPTPTRNAMLAGAVGLMLGVGLAFLRDYLDDTVKSNEDLKRATGGLNVLALIPSVPSWKDRTQPQVASLSDPASPASEAYRSLRTSVQFIGLEHPVQILQLTSPNASEGKTTTVANLGVALANAGQRVIIVCCDLRRPRIHEFFGLTNVIGFTSVLLGECPLSAALQSVPGVGRLALLASGPPPPNPSELLASRRTGEVLSALRSECDIVLVDSPPVLPVTDSIVLSGMVDATVLVGTAGRTTRKEYHRAVELLQQVDAPLVGTVLNGVEHEGLYGYGYGYGYYRFDKEPSEGNGSGGVSTADEARQGEGTPVASGANNGSGLARLRGKLPR